MNTKDFHLHSFFLDYAGIMANQESEFLSKFREKAESIFNKDLYSDINVQDKDGNTFLHHAMYSNLPIWCEKILRKGGNPLVENHEGRNAFRYASRKFSANYKVAVDNFFNKSTTGFCREFKQALFDGSVKGGIYEKSQFYQINEYLKSIDLDIDKNKINLSYANWQIPVETRIDYYLDNFDTPQNNSHFFELLTHEKKGDRVFSDEEIVERFLNREFVWDENFRKGLANLIRNTESNEKNQDTVDALVVGLDIMFDNKFSFNEHLEWNTPLEAQFLESESLKPIYMSIKLQNLLLEKSEKKSKTLKI